MSADDGRAEAGRADDGSAAGLLSGLRVVEVALLAPNMLGMHLADLGADVVKVEEPGRGDYTRAVGGARLADVSMLHVRWNRGKRSVAIDLRQPDGVAVFREWTPPRPAIRFFRRRRRRAHRDDF